MPALPVPFPLSTAPGAFNQEESGRLINCLAEPLGKTIGATKGADACRGVAQVAGADAVRRLEQCRLSRRHPGWRHAAVHGMEREGGDLRCRRRRDGAERHAVGHRKSVLGAQQQDADAGCRLCGAVERRVSGDGDRQSVLYPDIDVGAPNSVGFLDGYFIFTYGNGKMQASGLNATSINTLDFTTEQAKTGGLLRGLPFNGQYYVWGPNHGAVYANTAQPTGFPFTRSYVIQRGLLGRYAVAGHEDGFGSALIWVADDKSVVMANGTPNPTQDIAAGSRSADRQRGRQEHAGGECLHLAGPSQMGAVVRRPSPGSSISARKKWNERASYLIPRWRAISGISAFGKWITGDTKGNRLLSSTKTNSMTSLASR